MTASSRRSSNSLVTAVAEGWGWPGASRKAHYFVGVISLCRKWMYSGSLTKPGDALLGSDDCMACHRLLVKREAKKS